MEERREKRKRDLDEPIDLPETSRIRTNDIIPITRGATIEILNILNKYPKLYKVLQLFSYLINNGIVVNERLIEGINMVPHKVLEFIGEQIMTPFNNFLGEYYNITVNEITDTNLTLKVTTNEIKKFYEEYSDEIKFLMSELDIVYDTTDSPRRYVEIYQNARKAEKRLTEITSYKTFKTLASDETMIIFTKELNDYLNKIFDEINLYNVKVNFGTRNDKLNEFLEIVILIQ